MRCRSGGGWSQTYLPPSQRLSFVSHRQPVRDSGHFGCCCIPESDEVADLCRAPFDALEKEKAAFFGERLFFGAPGRAHLLESE